MRFRPKCRTVTSDTIRSTMISLSYLKGFSVHCVSGVDESARWIMKFAARLHSAKRPGKYETLPDGAASQPAPTTSFVGVCSRVKKDHITPQNALPIMLSQIPGVSTVTAEAVAEHYPTMYSLAQALVSDSNALATLTTTSATGKTRKISKNVRERIATFLGLDNLSAPSAQDD